MGFHRLTGIVSWLFANWNPKLWKQNHRRSLQLFRAELRSRTMSELYIYINRRSQYVGIQWEGEIASVSMTNWVWIQAYLRSTYHSPPGLMLEAESIGMPHISVTVGVQRRSWHIFECANAFVAFMVTGNGEINFQQSNANGNWVTIQAILTQSYSK